MNGWSFSSVYCGFESPLLITVGTPMYAKLGKGVARFNSNEHPKEVVQKPAIAFALKIVGGGVGIRIQSGFGPFAGAEGVGLYSLAFAIF